MSSKRIKKMYLRLIVLCFYLWRKTVMQSQSFLCHLLLNICNSEWNRCTNIIFNVTTVWTSLTEHKQDALENIRWQ